MTNMFSSRYRQRTITRDLTLGLVLTIVSVLISIAILNYLVSAARAEAELQSRATEIGDGLAAVLGAFLWNLDAEAIDQITEAYFQADNVVSIRVLDERNHEVNSKNSAVEMDNFIITIKPIFYENQLVGQVEVILTKKNVLQAQWNTLYSTVLMTFLVTLAVVIVTQRLLYRFLTTPLIDLTQNIDNIASGNYQLLMPTFQQSDIDMIGQRVNVMVTQIAARDQQLHELINTLEQRVAARTAQLQGALQETQGLFQAAQAILGSTELDEICRNLINQFNRLVQAHVMILYLVDHEKREVVLSVEHRVTNNKGVQLSYEELQQGISGIVFATKQPILSLDADDGIEPAATRARRIETGVGALIVVPFVVKGVVIGTITAINQVGQRVFTPHDVELLMALTTQAAAAIENIRLYQFAQQELVERKRAEAALQEANQELALANADKDKFFSIVAHDLKGPFMPLLGNAELLTEMGDMLPPTEVKQIGASIQRSARNTFGLLENLLAWARLQMGRMEYQPRRVDIYEVAAKTAELLSGNATVKQIELRNEVAPGTWVFADENMLDTVIRNLTNNALKFTPQGGQVIIRSEELGIRSQELTIPNSQFLTPNYIEVSIADTGVGMPLEVKQKLFKIDEHVTTVGTGQETGTGLGLIICQEMVLKSGGHIWVESELGQGTTVRFTVRLDRTN